MNVFVLLVDNYKIKWLSNCSIQHLGISAQEFSDIHRCNLHIISIALLALVCRVTDNLYSDKRGILSDYKDKIITDRSAEAPHLLPPLLETAGKFTLNIPQVMIDKVS